MTYQQLAEFVDSGMRLSHIYQPVMLIELLKHDGRMKDKEIARALLNQDQSQIDYYTTITNNMVGKVLRNRGVVERDRGSREYILPGFEALTDREIDDLVERCEKRLLDYIERRGERIFQHRRKSAGYISGTTRYEILKRARFRCELCGISAEEKALEVDHILPRNQGGTDDVNNLQALCYSCNSMKRDRDATDFRGIRQSYENRDDSCLFCNPPRDRLVSENELAYSMSDGFPVTAGHTLIIPKRHVADYFDLGQAEINACSHLLQRGRERIEREHQDVCGFNIGVNVGESAGQTIMHCHIHLIPRREGDTANPIGGVRNIIPGKGDYLH